jgi:ligand-binding sensor domain-containing protein/signal transduction histidine kinase
MKLMKICRVELLAFLLCLSTAMSQYVVKTWTTDNGLPQNTVNAIVQDEKGYLWIATFGGVVRFDGMRFSHVPQLEERMLSIRILSLACGKDNILWLGTEGGGLTRYDNNSIYTYTTLNGLPDDVILSLCEDDGTVWIGTRVGLCVLTDGTIQQVQLPNSSSKSWIESISKDGSGRIWFNTSTGVYVKDKKGEITQFLNLSGNDIFSPLFMGNDRNGFLWFRNNNTIIGTADSLVEQKSWRKIFRIKRDYKGILQDKEGVYWLWSNSKGIYYSQGDLVASPFISLPLSSGKAEYRVRCAFSDFEGNRWFGTDGEGLVRVTNSLFTVITTSQGLSNDVVEPALEDSRGNIWVGTNCGGVNILTPQSSSETFRIHQLLPQECVWSLAEDREGGIWIGTYGHGVYRVAHNQIQHFTTANGLSHNVVVALLCASDGSVWLGTDGGGLNRFSNGVFQQYTKESGLVNNNVRTIVQDTDGSYWIGTLGGLSHFVQGSFQNYTTENGLTTNYVRAIYRDSKNNLWIGTYGGGLLRFSNGKFQAVTKKKGLSDNIVSAITEDNEGYLWITNNKGVFRIQRDELVNVCEGAQEHVHTFAYGVEDGLLSSETNGGFQPAIWKTKNDILCIPTIKGLALLPLAKVYSSNSALKEVFIENVLVNGEGYNGKDIVELPYGSAQLEFRFSALNFRNANRILFEYKMEGFNEQWILSNTERSVFYNTLPPGRYKFYVRAFMNATTDVSSDPIVVVVKPPFWKRWEFIALCCLLLVSLLITAIYRKRAYIKRKDEERLMLGFRLLNSVEQERKQLANELHDTIGQELLIIKNRALLGLQGKRKKEMVEQFEEISSSVSRAIERSRELSYELRPYQIDRLSLTKAIDSLINRTVRGSGVKAKVSISIDDSKIPKEYGIHLYRIVQESVKNIVLHSHAAECQINLALNDNILSIAIQDNGQGFDQKALEAMDIKERGLGLLTIEERVAILKGTVSIASEQNRGTSINIQIPINGKDSYGEKN